MDEVKNRDIDAISLQLNALVNPPIGSIRLLRSPIKFQEWDGTQFVDKVLAVAGGGTGASTPAGAASGLGLGSMAFQNSNAINVTGGRIESIYSYGQFTHTGPMYIVAQGGPGFQVNGVAGSYTSVIIGSPASGQSWGLRVVAGFSGEAALAVVNYEQNKTGFVIYGTMVCQFHHRVIIPVGPDLWA